MNLLSYSIPPPKTTFEIIVYIGYLLITLSLTAMVFLAVYFDEHPPEVQKEADKIFRDMLWLFFPGLIMISPYLIFFPAIHLLIGGAYALVVGIIAYIARNIYFLITDEEPYRRYGPMKKRLFQILIGFLFLFLLAREAEEWKENRRDDSIA